MTYTPQPDFIGEDRFTYTISDGRGGTATATVVVFVSDGNLSANKVEMRLVPGGVLVRFAGIPGRAYDVQRAPDPSGPWNTLVTLTAPPHGIIEYIDTMPLMGAGFYRTAAVP